MPSYLHLAAVSFSTSPFRCLFCVPPRFSLAFLLQICRLKAYIVLWQIASSLWTGDVEGCSDCSLFNPNLAPCNASFLCLEWFKNQNLLTKNIFMSFSPLYVGAKDKNKMLTLIFFFLDSNWIFAFLRDEILLNAATGILMRNCKLVDIWGIHVLRVSFPSIDFGDRSLQSSMDQNKL